MCSRPRIHGCLRPLVRGPGQLQFGVSADSGAVVADGLLPAEMALLLTLDGTRTLDDLETEACSRGVSPARWSALVTALGQAGVLTTEQGTPEPASGLVLVAGDGPLPDAIAEALRTGVTTVRSGTWAVDDHEARLRLSESVGYRLHQPTTGRRARPDSCGDDAGRPDAVVLVAQPHLDPSTGDPWLRRGIPHLPVVAEGPRIAVGPVMGLAADGACLHCVDRHRADRDAAWPALRSQLEPVLRPRPVTADPALARTASGLVAMLVHALVRAHPVPAGVSFEVALPWPRVDHRVWPRHPRCAEHATNPVGPAAPVRSVPTSAGVTMAG